MSNRKLSAALCSFVIALIIALPIFSVAAWANDATTDATANTPTEAPATKTIPDERLLPRLTDNANLLTTEEAAELEAHLNELSQRLLFDIVIHTTDSFDGSSISAYADDYYDYNGFGIGANHDGVILVISMNTRDWYISSTGEGINTFTDTGIQYMGDLIVDDLGNGNYFDAFMTFADYTEDYVIQERNGAAYDEENFPRDQFKPESLAYGAVIGFIIALVLALYKKSQLKSVELREDAHDYVRMDTMRITQKYENFLHTSIATVSLSSESSGGGSSTHTGSSGTSHGGGGGKF